MSFPCWLIVHTVIGFHMNGLPRFVAATVTPSSRSDECIQILDEAPGTLRRYPSPRCTLLSEWVISVPSGYVVQLRYTHYTFTSKSDTLTIRDGGNRFSNLIGVHTLATGLPRKLESKGSTMYVALHAASHTVFEATYQQKGLCFEGQTACGYGESDCYLTASESCDGHNNCPMNAGDERNCGALDEKTRIDVMSTISSLLCGLFICIIGCVLCRMHRARIALLHARTTSPQTRLEASIAHCRMPPSYSEAVAAAASTADHQAAPPVTDDVPLIDVREAGGEGRVAMASPSTACWQRPPVQKGGGEGGWSGEGPVVAHGGDDLWSLVGSSASPATSMSSSLSSLDDARDGAARDDDATILIA